jgi:hypothetical protein
MAQDKDITFFPVGWEDCSMDGGGRSNGFARRNVMELDKMRAEV